MIGAFAAGGRCLAMFDGVRLRMWLEGETCDVISNGDCAVDPEIRSGLSRARARGRARHRPGVVPDLHGRHVPPAFAAEVLRAAGGSWLAPEEVAEAVLDAQRP